MRKLVVGLMVGMMAAGFVFGQQMTDDDRARAAMTQAETLYEAHDFAAAQAAYEAVVTDFPGAASNILAGAQTRAGMCLDRQHKSEEARVAYGKAQALNPTLHTGFMTVNSLVSYSKDHATGRATAEQLLSDYADGRVDTLVNVQGLIAKSYRLERNYEAAEAALAKIISDYPTASAQRLAAAQAGMGDMLAARGKDAEANTAYMTCVETYVWELGAADQNGIIWQVFGKISPKLADAAAYQTFLENTIKATKAVEENAEFLGRLKSELSKMQS